MMPLLHKFFQHRWLGKALLALLAGVYVVYLFAFAHTVFVPFWNAATNGITEHQLNSSVSVFQHWTADTMRNALNADEQDNNPADFSQSGNSTSAGKAAVVEGQLPDDSGISYPVETVGKIFFSDGQGRNYVCSGTAVVSQNHNTVDTAGHCLYGDGGWMQNVIFCPGYENGRTSYGCWAARETAVPTEWINARANELHRDYGMIIVAPLNGENLTDTVGGAGVAYNQSTSQTYYAYGYPAAHPFDGQTRKSCQGDSRSWQHAGGLVVSIPCNMTGGSSGGGWFIQINGNWYLNGHNDFTSTIKYGHMFSPYYDDVWYNLYNTAQQA